MSPRTTRGARAPLFSVAAILRNESVALPRLLESVGPFRSRGGDVVVLDTGSVDDTVRIALDAGCAVTRAPRRFNKTLTAAQADRITSTLSRSGEVFVQPGDRIFEFFRARNAADALARNDFVLAVDGSDVVEAMDIDFIDAQIRTGTPGVLPFETRRLSHGLWLLEQRPYLHDRRRSRWFGRAHNQVVPRRSAGHVGKVDLPRERLRVTHHTDPAKPRGHQLTGLALDVIESPQSPQSRLLLGQALFAQGHRHSAQSLLLDLDRADVPPSIRSSALAMAGSCLAEMRGTADDEVTDLWFRSARRDPGHRHPLLLLARTFLAEGKFQAAASFASAALAIPGNVRYTQLEENLRDGPHAILYWALFWLGRRTEAQTHHRICLAMDPGNAVYRDHARWFSY